MIVARGGNAGRVENVAPTPAQTWDEDDGRTAFFVGVRNMRRRNPASCVPCASWKMATMATLPTSAFQKSEHASSHSILLLTKCFRARLGQEGQSFQTETSCKESVLEKEE